MGQYFTLLIFYLKIQQQQTKYLHQVFCSALRSKGPERLLLRPKLFVKQKVLQCPSQQKRFVASHKAFCFCQPLQVTLFLQRLAKAKSFNLSLLLHTKLKNDNKKINIYLSYFYCSLAFYSCLSCTYCIFFRCNYSNAIYSTLIFS